MTPPTTNTRPLDIDAMRTSADCLLAEDAEAPSPEELETLTLQLRGHLMLTIPEVETAALALPADSESRACSIFCVGEARLRLSGEPGRTLPARIAHAQRLARSVRVLCDHYEYEDHRCPSAPERAAYLRMLEHYPECPACRTAGDQEEGTGLCSTGDRLHQEYRQARRGPGMQPGRPRPEAVGD
ncbi:DUF6415 family natural product biosynthesis protein [Streptomyces sp. NPDC052610]|uniref:DUF6415 family natural product biosynthesis protein n=1 Tax=Streptomyces sp. NPDC052610 TaxID=3154952 RepID=UPI003444D463